MKTVWNSSGFHFCDFQEQQNAGGGGLTSVVTKNGPSVMGLVAEARGSWIPTFLLLVMLSVGYLPQHRDTTTKHALNTGVEFA